MALTKVQDYPPVLTFPVIQAKVPARKVHPTKTHLVRLTSLELFLLRKLVYSVKG